MLSVQPVDQKAKSTVYNKTHQSTVTTIEVDQKSTSENRERYLLTGTKTGDCVLWEISSVWFEVLLLRPNLGPRPLALAWALVVWKASSPSIEVLQLRSILDFVELARVVLE